MTSAPFTISTSRPYTPGSGPSPTGYLETEKSFLKNVFALNDAIGAAFAACERMLPDKRPKILLGWAQSAKRQVWSDTGVPPERCETLADHTGTMQKLAATIPLPDGVNPWSLPRMISLWQMPLTVVGEIPLEMMPFEKRHHLRDLAVRMIFDHHSFRHERAAWVELDRMETATAKWAGALDYMATAKRARAYQNEFPHLVQTMESLIANCRHALTTDYERMAFDKIAAPRPVKIEISLGRPAAVPEGLFTGDSGGAMTTPHVYHAPPSC